MDQPRLTLRAIERDPSLFTPELRQRREEQQRRGRQAAAAWKAMSRRAKRAWVRAHPYGGVLGAGEGRRATCRPARARAPRSRRRLAGKSRARSPGRQGDDDPDPVARALEHRLETTCGTCSRCPSRCCARSQQLRREEVQGLDLYGPGSPEPDEHKAVPGICSNPRRRANRPDTCAQAKTLA